MSPVFSLLSSEVPPTNIILFGGSQKFYRVAYSVPCSQCASSVATGTFGKRLSYIISFRAIRRGIHARYNSKTSTPNTSNHQDGHDDNHTTSTPPFHSDLHQLSYQPRFIFGKLTTSPDDGDDKHVLFFAVVSTKRITGSFHRRCSSSPIKSWSPNVLPRRVISLMDDAIYICGFIASQFPFHIQLLDIAPF